MKWLALAVISVGISATFVKLGSVYPKALFIFVSYLSGFLALFLSRPEFEEIDLRYPAGISLLNFAGFYALLLALGSGDSASVFPVTSMSVVVTAFLSFFLLKERFSRNKLAATFFAFLAVAFLV